MNEQKLRALVERMEPAPWVQLSGKYLAVDRDERPQVFRALHETDEVGIMALRNAAPALLACVEALRRLHDDETPPEHLAWCDTYDMTDKPCSCGLTALAAFDAIEVPDAK